MSLSTTLPSGQRQLLPALRAPPSRPAGMAELLSAPHRKGFQHTARRLASASRFPAAFRTNAERLTQRRASRWAPGFSHLPPRQGRGFGSTLVKPAAPVAPSLAAPGSSARPPLLLSRQPSVVKFLPKLPQPFLFASQALCSFSHREGSRFSQPLIPDRPVAACPMECSWKCAVGVPSPGLQRPPAFVHSLESLANQV